MINETIFTLDARDNIYFDVLNEYNFSQSALYDEINKSFKNCILILEKKNINYKELKSCLTPNCDKNEIAFVFDWVEINSYSYGYDVFSKLFPLFDKQSSHSVLCGDFCGDSKLKEKLKSIFFENIKSYRRINYVDHKQFYMVYINNLSDKMLSTINEGLKKYNPYIGYFDLTYSSYLKTYLSFILSQHFIKNKTTIIVGNIDDKSNEENLIDFSYPIEENDYKCISIQSIYYDIFLSYKIERQVYDGLKNDTFVSINAISKNVFDISDFTLFIEKGKFAYLLKEKSDNLERAGITNLTIEELEILIKSKINSNYIYNLTFLEQFQTLKFNIILEVKRNDGYKRMKLIVALEYKPIDKILRLITMF